MAKNYVKRNRTQMSDSFLTASFIILSGGFQDAYTYCCRDRVFANAQTGNIVLMSSHLFEGEWRNALLYLVPILAFILGTFAAESIRLRYQELRTVHWRQIIVAMEIFLLFLVGFVPIQMNFLANAVVSFVCAMQVQAFKKVHGYAYASTMCIGNMRSGTEALCLFLHNHDKATLLKALTYFRVIGIFAIGAGAGSFITLHWGERAIWACCLLLSVSFTVMSVSGEQNITHNS